MVTLDLIHGRAVQDDSVVVNPGDAGAVHGRECRRVIPVLDEPLRPLTRGVSRELEWHGVQSAAPRAVITRRGDLLLDHADYLNRSTRFLGWRSRHGSGTVTASRGQRGRHRTEWRRLRRPPVKFVYELVVFGLGVLISTKIHSGFPRQPRGGALSPITPAQHRDELLALALGQYLPRHEVAL